VIPVVIPAKPLDRALSRLSGVLSPTQRMAVQVAMLTDVIGAAARFSDQVAVVSSDEQVHAIALDCGAVPVEEPRPAIGIDAAVAAGTARFEADEVLVVMGDLPMTMSEDLAALVAATGGHQAVGCAASADGTGTNALVLRPPAVISTRFGPNSLRLHLDEARRVDASTTVLTLPGLERDIDTPQDLDALLRSGHDCATARVCRRLGVDDALVGATSTR